MYRKKYVLPYLCVNLFLKEEIQSHAAGKKYTTMIVHVFFYVALLISKYSLILFISFILYMFCFILEQEIQRHDA